MIRLPVTWAVCGFVQVDADTIEEAIEYFNEHSDHIPLPYGEEDYVDGSFELSFTEPEAIETFQA